MNKFLVVMCLCLPAFGQATYSEPGASSGSVTYVISGQGILAGENAYCTPGTGVEVTEGTPTWGTSDGPAGLSSQCMNTAMSSTPSGTHIGGGGAATFVPATATTLANVLASTAGSPVNLDGTTGGSYYLQCGDAIQLAAGLSYQGSFTLPDLACDGGHWILVKSSGIGNANFPGEGLRATPCLAGISNDATNGRNLPGYPDYICSSYPAVLTAKVVTGSINNAALSFASGANHYRFIGLEITKVAGVQEGGALAVLMPDGVTMGANHVIFDRSLIHGQPWTLAATNQFETQGGIKAKNSQWVSAINSWIYDTYCVASCIDSQAFAAGAGTYQDGPFKLYNNLLATSGESWMFGGGGVGVGTPNTQSFEARENYSLKNLGWMTPIDTCYLYDTVYSKNLGEAKGMNFALIEGNVFENSWQGCQSDQTGHALLLSPKNQNTHQPMAVTFDGTNVVTAADSNSFSHNNGSPGDAANCAPGGCILEIADASRSDNGTDYRFCDGTNGCDQSGMNLTTQARLSSVPAAGTPVNVNSCVPGLCPACKVRNVVVRYNEIYNATQGLAITSSKDSHCLDEASGLDHVMVRDNLLHGLSDEMSNAVTPYQQSEGIELTSGQEQGIINTVEVSHNTVAIETGNNGGFGGLGHQTDRTDHNYLTGFNVHDNVSPAPWIVAHGSGSITKKGIGGAAGLGNTYPTDACQSYYPNDAGSDIQNGYALNNVGAGTSFTFSPSLASYLVTVNGSYSATTANTSTSFTLTAALNAGDSFTVRDLNTCNWIFAGNLLGTGLPGSAAANDPYPASNNTACGVSGTASCILDGSAFTSLFANWGTGRTGDFTLTSSTYQNSATDAATRGPTGKNPGADLAVLGQVTQGVRGTTYYAPLSVTSGTLTAATHGVAYQAALQASGGASPYESWWLETTAANCPGGTLGSLPANSGIVIGRDGVVNGPFVMQTVSRSSGVSTFNPQIQMVAPSGSPWQSGQTIALSGFVDSGTGDMAHDSSFNGTCTISAATSTTFSCSQPGTGYDNINSHAPLHAGGGTPTGVATFAPITPAAYQFCMGAKDGAFQKAWAQIAVTVN